MIAGTILMLAEPADEPLESWFRGGGALPALDVNLTQDSLDGRPVQSGEAATTIVTERDEPTVASDFDGNSHSIVKERAEVSEKMHIDWVADVTGTGLFLASSVEGTEISDFPVDLIYNVTGHEPKPREVDVEGLHIAWDEADALDNTWLNAADGGNGTRIDYHEDASEDLRATIGLGFKRLWSGTLMEGVVYESGYIALYTCSVPSDAVRFIEEEILPHAYVDEGDVGRTEEGETCERCGRESDSIKDGHCVVCRDKLEEESEDVGQNTTLDDLDSVSMAGGESDGE
jgi:hypothetical protein